jgi:hypothetical protein
MEGMGQICRPASPSLPRIGGFMQTKRDFFKRMVIAAFILLSGVALLPYIDLPQTTLGWELFAGIYQPELEVDEPLGQPGSIFTFTGSNYPANSQATVYVAGDPIGTVMTDENGTAVFYINTGGAALGIYNVTMEVDVNASATNSFELDANAPLIPPPGDPGGPTFSLVNRLFLPFITNG